MFGSRPRIVLTRAYSAALRPCSAAISGVTRISVLAVAIFQIYEKNWKSQEHDSSCPYISENRADQSRGITDHAVALAAPTSASTMERKITKPSEAPSTDSTARSGSGMRPATVLSPLQTPA